MRDVTEEKDLENRLRFFTLLAENSLDLILVADPEGVALYVNPRVEERTAQLEAVVSKLETQGRMLRESEEMFRSTFELAAVGMAHVSPNGRFLRAN